MRRENPLWRMSEVKHMAPKQEAAGLAAGGGPGERLGSCGVIYTSNTSSCLNGIGGGGGRGEELHQGQGKSWVKPLSVISVSHKPNANRQFPSFPHPCTSVAYLIN